MGSRVFISHEVSRVAGRQIDLTPALDFGEPVYVIPATMAQITFDATSAVDVAAEKLAKFNDEDYILPIGDPVAIGLVCAIAARVNSGRFRVLKWDRQEERYYVTNVDVGEI